MPTSRDWSVREFARYLGRIAADAAPSALGAGDGRSALTQALESFIDPCRIPSPAREVQRHLLDEIVYIVLNHTPLRRPDERDFVAALNWANVAQTTRDYLTKGGTSGHPATGMAPECVFLQCGGPCANEPLAQRAERLWTDKWSEYFEITGEAEKERLFTWNQYLLRGCRKPSCLGLSWGVADDPDDRDDAYSSIGVDAAQAIGLPSADDPRWTEQLLRLEAGGPHRDVAMPSDLERLRDRWQEMEAMGGDSALEGIPWAVFHLVRSYAIWGGAAFISIPVHFGKDAPNRTAVVSLCSNAPLTPERIDQWNLLAWAMLNPIVAEEALGMMARSVRLAAYEGIGHQLKNSVQMTGWRGIHLRLREEASSVDEQDLSNLLHLAANSMALFSLSEGLGGILRLVTIIENRYFDKVAPWVDPQALAAWETGDAEYADQIVSQYAETLLAISRMICLGLGATMGVDIEYRRGDAWELGRWRYLEEEEADAVFDPKELAVPPFRAGTDAFFVVTMAFVEPILNAAKAMAKDPVISKDRSIPLRVRVSAAIEDDHLLVEVGNATSERRPPDKFPTGLNAAQTLLELTEMGWYDPFRVSPDDRGNTVFWLPIRFYPARLARLITGQNERS